MGFGKDGKGVMIRESRSNVLGALAQGVGVQIDTKLATLERFRMLRGEIFATVTGLTSGEGTGLILVLADGDLSLTEVDEAIDSANGPLGPNDQVIEAIAERPVWLIAAVDRETGPEAMFENDQGGHMLVIKPRWTFARTKSWNWIVYNLGSILTTGATVHIRTKLFGVWVT